MAVKKVIDLPCHGIIVTLYDDGSGNISSDLKEKCDFCGSVFCDMFCVDAQEEISNRDFEGQQEKRRKLREKANDNRIIDAYESFILACAYAGIDIESPMFIAAIEVTVDSHVNHC
ncbi:hypothetical protein LCGC14_0608490 [marine sediment metagenome]|uniref:Uncharacterized protein n=1 Tax=marine sediment metagenome TaxID=412755 RepID=A0A0F9TUN3_9ZZZZ